MSVRCHSKRGGGGGVKEGLLGKGGKEIRGNSIVLSVRQSTLDGKF